jgi:pimeloyl-ACP methyl ester carboxylesterase
MEPAHKPLPPSKVWLDENRTGQLRSNGDRVALMKLISVPLNGKNNRDGVFDLYYFVRMPEKGKRAEKTVVFCAGGPGETVMPDDSIIWFQELPGKGAGYNVVYFHLRGSGFSQIPPSNGFDKFLRTKYAVEDVEEIRRDFLGDKKKWDAVIGYSYGSILAQQYAHKHPNMLDKLVLIAPTSKHKFSPPADPLKAFNDYLEEVQNIRRQIVDHIYDLPEFERRLTTKDKVKIKDKLLGYGQKSGIFRTIDDKFGSEQFVIENYKDLKRIGALKRYGLGRYSLEFFRNLRALRNYGWKPDLADAADLNSLRVNIGKVIAKELNIGRIELPAAQDADARAPQSNAQGSRRSFYVFEIYDGINEKFLREWLGADKKNFRGALARSAGEAHIKTKGGLNRYVDKVGIADADIKSLKPWDPMNYQHNRPTLILKGTADPVTAGGQAEYYLEHASTEFRVLVEFEGVGHQFILPQVNVPTRILDELCRRGMNNALQCLIPAFIELVGNDFCEAAKSIYHVIWKEGAAVRKREPR